ncbi:GlxA family transcriptional regulator [Muricauda sp. MAR_2010_75]|jgi:transcriptional regulator GlxA family with amidase domain|uniref:GlxA family transcriptional regulator n=1 Tax=Allomuricauda sp. MAR_2010_75 TaxID=1250232 RepID=UPI0005650D60|nr:helix-turn-helix domain-containing protein [Muricauda sp. MAR_2010_75]
MSGNQRFFFLVPPQVQLLDITGPAHLFYEAKEYGAEIETIYLSLDDAIEQQSGAGIALGNLTPFHQHSLGPNDLLFVPGMDVQILFTENISKIFHSFFEWLREQYQHGAKICSVCTGAYLLGYAGLLDGKECTTHWKYMEDFQSRFPKAKVLSDRLIIKDGNLYSSAGVSSGIDLSLFIIEELFGPVFTSKIAKEVVIFLRRTENDPQLSVFLQYRNHIDTRIHQVQDVLAQNLSTKTAIEELAEIVHMSPRNLTRLFKKTTGITIGDYLDKLRVERAIQMLSSGSKVSAAASACGLQSPNQLRSLLKKHTTSLPSDWHK